MIKEKTFKIIFMVIGLLFILLSFLMNSIEILENLLIFNLSYFFETVGRFFFLLGFSCIILGLIITNNENKFIFSPKTTYGIYIFLDLIPFLLVIFYCINSTINGESNFFETIYGAQAFISSFIWISVFSLPLYITELLFILNNVLKLRELE